MEFVWEFTSFQPTHERMNWWASLSPISKHPRELLFGASCLGIKPGWAKFAIDEEEEEGWGITTDLGGSTDLLLDQVTVSRWTDQILWPFLEQEFWTKITTEMHKAKRPGKHLMDPVNYKAFSHTLVWSPPCVRQYFYFPLFRNRETDLIKNPYPWMTHFRKF